MPQLRPRDKRKRRNLRSNATSGAGADHRDRDGETQSGTSQGVAGSSAVRRPGGQLGFESASDRNPEGDSDRGSDFDPSFGSDLESCLEPGIKPGLEDGSDSDGDTESESGPELETAGGRPLRSQPGRQRPQPPGRASQPKLTTKKVAGQTRLPGADIPNLTLKRDWFDGNTHPAEYYRHGLKTFREQDYDRKEYAPGTEEELVRVDAQWRRFCSKILRKDWLSAYQKLTLSVLYQFLDWVLNQNTGAQGKLKRGIKKKTSLRTYWGLFRLAFGRATLFSIDALIDRRRLSNALVELGNKHSLDDDKRENRSMTLDDLKLQIETTLSTTDKSYKLGEQRILAVLFLLLLAPGGSRPTSILELRYGDIQISLARDPDHGPHRLLLRFTLEYTKRYLGKKAAKTFLIPEIIYDPSLLLSPHVFLLGILFRHRAFLPDELNDNPAALASLDIYEGEFELRIPIKPELKDVRVFRRAKQTPLGYEIDKSQGITIGMMSDWVRTVGQLLGFEYPTIAYGLRYMAGNSLDRSVNVSEALRNLVMDHGPNSDVFQRNYLNRNVCVDLWAIHRKDQPQQALIEKAASHGHSRSQRRPATLTPAQSTALKNHPEILAMKARLRKIPERTPEYRALALEFSAAKTRLRRATMQNIRKEWTAKQAMDDIKRQLNGHGLKAAKPGRSNTRSRVSKHQRLVDALMAPLAGTSVDAQFRRRADAISAIVAYCSVEEAPNNKLLDAAAASQPPELQHIESAAEKLRSSVFVRKPGDRLRRCFICVGKALALSTSNSNLRALSELCRPHTTAFSMTRHFRNVHLSHVQADTQLECPVCPGYRLKNKMHLQNHADSVHGIKTDFRPF